MSRMFRHLLPLHAALCALLLSCPALAIDASRGLYRIPFADDTRVKVTHDHRDHDPPGRIDMHGVGGDGTYRIVAAADGVVRRVVDGFSARLDCDDLAADRKQNNYVWIEHANGEWSKYTHMRRHSASVKAGLRVGQAVSAGTYLGDEGEVGCASGEHLHFEIGVPKNANAISTVGGFLTDNDGSRRNRIPRICGIADERFVHDTTYRAPGDAIAPGAGEIARHGVPASDYQCLFDRARRGGYALDWIDGFDVGGKVYYNAVFRPWAGDWGAVHGLTATQYQQRFDDYTRQGYRPYQVETYGSANGVRYAAIYRKAPGPAYAAYHGLSAAAHQQRMDALVADGYRPRNIAVAVGGGERRYTALFEKADIGAWDAKSKLDAAGYQSRFDANAREGRHLVYLVAYRYGGQPHFSAIWSARAGAGYTARHGLTSTQYQAEWNSATAAHQATRDVSGYDVGGSARYAAFWR